MHTNNKLREALVQVQKKINYLIGNLTVPNSLVANRMEINGIINAALADPPRNCDVGTLEERRERFKQFCKSHSSFVMCNRDCPLYNLHITGYSCHFEWGELPIESGGAVMSECEETYAQQFCWEKGAK